jgi:hypothetical protein
MQLRLAATKAHRDAASSEVTSYRSPPSLESFDAQDHVARNCSHARRRRNLGRRNRRRTNQDGFSGARINAFELMNWKELPAQQYDMS